MVRQNVTLAGLNNIVKPVLFYGVRFTEKVASGLCHSQRKKITCGESERESRDLKMLSFRGGIFLNKKIKPTYVLKMG